MADEKTEPKRKVRGPKAEANSRISLNFELIYESVERKRLIKQLRRESKAKQLVLERLLAILEAP